MDYEGGDIRTAMEAADRQELVSLMEPLTIVDGSRHRAGLNDLALDLAQKAAGFRRSLPPQLARLTGHARTRDELLLQQPDRGA